MEEWIPLVLRFLYEEASKGKSLFLVGDLFDFWFEWKHAIPARSFKVLAALHELTRSGIEIYYLGGNHDGHVWKHLENEVGVHVSRESVNVQIDDKTFHIIHGDGVAQNDRGYRMLRSLVRWKPTEAIFRLIHPDFGIWLAGRVSKLSREHLSHDDKFGAEPYREYAKWRIDQGYNYVVMGHRHSSEWIPHTNGGYLAIGDWIGRSSYGLFSQNVLELKEFNSKA